MKWGDITPKDHGKKVSVTAKSTPKSPLRGEGPFVGKITFGRISEIPLLQIGDEVHSFAGWWDVEFLKEK